MEHDLGGIDGQGEETRKSRPGEWIDTPEGSPAGEEVENRKDEEKEKLSTPKSTQREVISTPKSRHTEAGSERIDSVMRGGGEGIFSSRFLGVSPEFRAGLSKEE